MPSAGLHTPPYLQAHQVDSTCWLVLQSAVLCKCLALPMYSLVAGESSISAFMSKALLEAIKRFCVIVCFLLQPGDPWAVGCVAVTPVSPVLAAV